CVDRAGRGEVNRCLELISRIRSWRVAPRFLRRVSSHWHLHTAPRYGQKTAYSGRTGILKMTSKEARYQSLAACGAVLIAFIGVCHEFIGHIVFPWGPSTLGGPIGWHGLGILSIVIGLLMLGGILGLIRFPVVFWALMAATIGVAICIFTAVVHHEFHMF